MRLHQPLDPLKSLLRLSFLTVAALFTAPALSAQDAPARVHDPALPPGGPPPRLPDGQDFTGHWLPNGAGQG